MRLSEHHRHCILFLFEQGRSVSEAHVEMLRVFPDVDLTHRSIQSWFVRFRSGDKDVTDNSRAGRPSAIDDDQLLALVRLNPRQTTHDLGRQLECSQTTLSDPLRQVGCVWKLFQWVPHELKADHKLMRVAICDSLLSRNSNDPLLSRSELSLRMRSGLNMRATDVVTTGKHRVLNFPNVRTRSQIFTQNEQCC
jgi:histone-lysine N-methyltransferase SETMAR